VRHWHHILSKPPVSLPGADENAADGNSIATSYDTSVVQNCHIFAGQILIQGTSCDRTTVQLDFA